MNRSSRQGTTVQAWRRCLVGSFLAACALTGPTSRAHAGTAHAYMEVGATVMAVAALQSDSSPSELVVSEADVVRGYVEVKGATRLLVRNTSRHGFSLDIWFALPAFSSVVVGNGSGEFILGPDGGELVERQTGAMLPVVLDFRFQLAPGVLPGRYPWPLKLRVQPLAF